MAAIDVTGAVGAVLSQSGPVIAVGGAVLLVYVVLQSYRWVRSALGADVSSGPVGRPGPIDWDAETADMESVEPTYRAATDDEQAGFDALGRDAHSVDGFGDADPAEAEWADTEPAPYGG